MFSVTKKLELLREHTVTNEREADITVSTAHRSKGLEWERVVLGDDFQDIADLLMSEQERRDETNLLYVAVTRARRTLVLNELMQQLAEEKSRTKEKTTSRMSVAQRRRWRERMFKLRKFFTSGSAVEIPDDGRSVPGTPEGFYAPLTTDSLLMPKNRAQCLKQIRDNNMMPKPLCEAMCCVRIQPASLHAECPGGPGGALVTCRGIRGPDVVAYQLRGPSGPCTYVSAGRLCGRAGRTGGGLACSDFLGSPVLSPASACASGRRIVQRPGMAAGISVPDEAYRFRFRQTPPQGTEAQQLAAVIAGGLLPEGAAAWLATVPGALQNLAGAFWHQHPEMALIRDVLQERPVRLKVRC